MAQRHNPVADAVTELGGVIKASIVLEISNQAMRDAADRGWMPNVTPAQKRRAQKLADKSGVPLLELLTGKRVA